MKLKSALLKIVVGQIIIDILAVIAFYFLIPILMNYSTYSIELNFVQEHLGISYFSQACLMFIPYIFLITLFLVIYLKDMIKFGKYSIEDLPKQEKNKMNLRLANIPIFCYLLKVLFVPIVLIGALILISSPTLTTIKLTIIISMFFLFNATIIYTYTKYILKGLIQKSKNFNVLYGVKMSVRNEILIQFISIFCASLTFVFVFAYSRIIEEKGDAIYYSINTKLSDYFINTTNNIEDKELILKDLKDLFENNDTYTYFCVEPNQKITILDDKELPDYTKNLYIDKMVQMNENRIYDVSKESQGIIEVINSKNGQYIYGVFFSIIPLVSLKYFLYTLIILLMLNIMIILFYCRNLAKNISEVSTAIETVASGHEVDFEKKIAVTSNDEIGELVIAFNKILELEKENVETKERNQDIMVEQERLSSLGQLIGGIAHNLKTPIMSIAGVVEGLTDLIKEYDESIDDPSVNKQDHHEIAKDMQEWVDKVKPYLSYMTEVIDTVKGQAVSLNSSTNSSFSAKEFILRTEILMKDELKRKHCTLNVEADIKDETSIKGELNAIVQVLDNLIINSMDAYGENGGEILLKIFEDKEKVYIEVQDNAGGIPLHVKDKIFKEMVTGKGKNGTGLGLYISYSTIKGKFNGDMRFITNDGDGTTFYIELLKQ